MNTTSTPYSIDISDYSDTTPKDRFEKVALNSDGRRMVQHMVKKCLKLGISPDCSIEIPSGTCNSEIVSISIAELEDLLRKYELAMVTARQ